MRLYKYLAIGLSALLFSCEEETRGPLTADSIPPKPVSEVVVINQSGGATITYSIPDDEDVLLVEAIYKLDNGKRVTSKSSIFKNHITVEGLRKVQVQDIELVAVDRSNNRSTSVFVTINPEAAPIDKLFSSFTLVEDFGGVRLSYDNEEEISAELLLYTADESGNWVYSQSVFIADDHRSHQTFRGFPPISSKFGVAAIDRWDNATEMLTAEKTPLEEVILDQGNFKDVFLTGDEPDAWGWTKSNLWNGSVGGSGFHTAQGQPGTLVPPYLEEYHMLTIDLGVRAKLSRFKFWQRQDDYAYTHGNPRYFEVWGNNEIPEDRGASLIGWTKLIERGEVVKPSGGPIGKNSAEDVAKAASGEEFEFPIEAAPVRYIRFVNIESWSTGKFMHMMEINFWGQIAD